MVMFLEGLSEVTQVWVSAHCVCGVVGVVGLTPVLTEQMCSHLIPDSTNL